MTHLLSDIHPTRAAIHAHVRLAQRLSDAITGFVGSYWFIWLHLAWFSAWIGFRIEAFPFGLLTMIVSLEAILLSTLVMISQNRQGEKDRVRDDLEAHEVEELFENHQLLLTINREQVEFFLALFAHFGLALPPSLKEHYAAFLLEKPPSGGGPSTLVRAHRRRLTPPATTKKLELSEEQKEQLLGDALGVLGTAIRQQVSTLDGEPGGSLSGDGTGSALPLLREGDSHMQTGKPLS